jgi:hypothetical protein
MKMKCQSLNHDIIVGKGVLGVQ